MEEIKTLIILIESHGLAVVIACIAIIFTTKLIDALLKVGLDLIKQKVSPGYKDAKIVKIECLLKTFFNQYLGELISSCSCIIRAGIFKVGADGKLKPYFTATDLGYSQSLLSEYSAQLLENITANDDVAKSVFIQYGVKSLIVKSFDLNHGRYFLVTECTEPVMSDDTYETVEHQTIALGVLLRIYDDILGPTG